MSSQNNGLYTNVKLSCNGRNACKHEFNDIDLKHNISSEQLILNNGQNDKSNELNKTDQISYDEINRAATYLLNNTKYRPKIGIICGSGLGPLAESIENADIIPYQEIPNFPVSTVEGHSGKMIIGDIKNVPVMCMQGRFHYYEGYSLDKCCMPIRVMKLVGVTHVIVTNAAGGLNDKYNVGDIMILKDHINFLSLAGSSPLRGANEPRFGRRFLPMNKAYDVQLKNYALDVAHELGIGNEVHEGVYMCTGGPTYETVAECRMAKLLGADCLGMSTVHEATIARHCNIKVLAISFISNKCISDYECNEEPDHEEVVSVGKNRQPVLTELVQRLVVRIGTD